ncbi:MAG: methyltransferase domain-containing protein [Acidobacteriota bacterium]|nr:methyltransferase domain-containing protein [Acidobacteriota bacterium]
MQVDPTKLIELYDQRYAGDMKFQTSPKGLHSVIASELGERLRGADVLDIGCGAGRLALFCAAQGARVTALDFSPKAIDVARMVASSLERPVDGVEFAVGRFEDLDRAFDIVLMTEVFEHIETAPPDTLRQLRALVKPGGIAVLSSPGFVNLRGISWMTLQNLFGFLMSPSDVHFIHAWDMKRWCDETGWAIESHLGMFHDWGWGDWSARDMTRRIGLALRDQRKSDSRWQAIEVNLDAMNHYLTSQAAYFQDVLETDAAKLMRHSEVPVEALRLRAGTDSTDVGREMQEYLADARVPYANSAPLNAMGATNIFFCRRT